MLTQGPTPDSKCKLNISSFFTLTHLLDCLICTRNFMSIVLLLQMEGVGKVRVVDCRQGQGYYLVVSCFFFHLCFCSLFSHVFFICPSFLSD